MTLNGWIQILVYCGILLLLVKKIERTPDQPRYIITETGVGYRLREIDE